MEETLISYETAKLAKEKGFKEYTSTGYAVNGDVYLHQGGQEPVITGEKYYEGFAYIGSEFLCSRPSQSLLQKWLREKHNIFLYIIRDTELNITYIINDEYFYDCGPWNGNFKTYEEALELGLQKALNLIK